MEGLGEWQDALMCAVTLNTQRNERPMSQIIQFNWSINWKMKVEPYLNWYPVRASVEMGMRLVDPNWTWKDGPHAIGRKLPGLKVRKKTLSWYQPWGRCHWISFFSCAIGVLNYPELDWQFLSGPLHTVPVGSLNGQYRVVMDILNFDEMTAEQSIEFAQRVLPGAPETKTSDDQCFDIYVMTIVPALREIAYAARLRKKRCA
jgi:hypothetical protein